MALTKVPSNLDSITATTQSQGDGSTNVATTAYVDTGLSALIDSAPGNLNTLNELAAAMNDNASFFSTVLPLSGGTMTGDLILGDSVQIEFGAASGGDANIRHDGSNTKFSHTGSGGLYIGADLFAIQNGSHNENYLTTAANGSVQIYYDNSLKLLTSSTGINLPLDGESIKFGANSEIVLTHEHDVGLNLSGSAFKVKTTSSTANDRAGAGFTATESSTDSSRRALMYLDADNGAFTTGDSGAYFYMEKIGGGGEVNFINQDTSGYNFRTGGSHVRMNIASNGKASWSANGIGSVGTVPRDFPFYTEGSSNGVEVRSNDERLVMLGAGGSGGTAVDDGYLAIASQGTTKIALNANGDSYFDGGNLGLGLTDPDARLEIKSTGGGSESALKVTDASSNNVFIQQGGGRAIFHYGPVMIGAETDIMHNNMDDLQIGNAVGNRGMTIASGNGSYGTLAFADGSSGNEAYRGFVEYYHNDDSMRLGSGGVERIRVADNGKIIHKSYGSGDNIMTFIETQNSSDTGIAFGRNGTNNLKTGLRSSSNGSSSIFQIKLSLGESEGTQSISSPQFQFYHNGNLAITGSYSSDRRLKENIVSIPEGSTAFIKQLNPVSFNMIGSTVTKAGFIAQEVEALKPSLINGGEVDEQGEEIMRGVDYFGILAHAIKTIQELEARIATLEG